MDKSPIEAIFSDLVTSLSTVIDTKSIFLGSRPKTIDSDSTIKKFITIELPSEISDIAAGNKQFVLNTTGYFYLFVKAKSNGTLNLHATSELEASVKALFPIVGEYCGASSPRTRMARCDDYGYQFITITFDLQTKANIFSSN